MVTGDYIYLFDREKLSRVNMIVNMVAFLKSTQTKEFVLSFQNEKSLRCIGLKAELIKDLKNVIQLRHVCKCP